MNYIQSLQEENKALKEKLNQVRVSLCEFQQFLTCPKFQGVESDGSRKDWISTGDVHNHLREIINITI